MVSIADQWRGPNLKFQIFQLGLIGIVFLFFYDIVYGFAFIITYWVSFQYYLLWSDKKLEDEHKGEVYYDTHTIETRECSEDIIYCSNGDPEPIEMFTRAAKELENTPEYQETQALVMKIKADKEDEIKKVGETIIQALPRLAPFLLEASKPKPEEAPSK